MTGGKRYKMNNNLKNFIRNSEICPTTILSTCEIGNEKVFVFNLSNGEESNFFFVNEIEELIEKKIYTFDLEEINFLIAERWKKEKLPMTSKKDSCILQSLVKMITRPEEIDQINFKKIEWFLHKTSGNCRWGSTSSITHVNLISEMNEEKLTIEKTVVGFAFDDRHLKTEINIYLNDHLEFSREEVLYNDGSITQKIINNM